MPPLTISADGQPPLNEVIDEMLTALEAEANLPLPAGSLPPPNLSLVRVQERPVGLGRWRGNETQGPLPLLALKGGRLDAVVRFQLWANVVADIDAAILQLQADLSSARDVLRGQGFLKLTASDTSLAEQVSTGVIATAWRKTASYHLLYEYHYRDTDGAESLIARIPVESDPEERNSPQRETSIVTGATVRWDNETAPALRQRGPGRFGRISALVFLPGATPAGQVNLLRTFDGAAGAPAAPATLNDFLNAVADPQAPARHAEVSFASLTDFLNAFAPPDDTVTLGDWDEDAALDSYEIRALDLVPAIPLPRDDDRLEISIVPAPLDQVAVLYLRLERG